jgi:adenine phosphoribosyltransferase
LRPEPDTQESPVFLDLDRDALARHIRDVPDFPEPGVTFKDVTPLLLDHEAFSTVVDATVMRFGRGRVDKVVGIEARGFILAAPIAYHFGAGFVPARKLGKLPGTAISAEYVLEYGRETLEMHTDAIHPGDRVLVVDDVLATGGTAAAAVDLVQRLGGIVVGVSFLVELTFIRGAAQLEGFERFSLIEY